MGVVGQSWHPRGDPTDPPGRVGADGEQKHPRRGASRPLPACAAHDLRDPRDFCSLVEGIKAASALVRGARQQVAGHPVRPCAVEMLAAEGGSTACASCLLLHRGVCCMSVGSGFGPSSRVVNSFQLNKGIALVGFESLLCCAAWDKFSDLRSRLGCCCCPSSVQSGPWAVLNGPVFQRSRGGTRGGRLVSAFSVW